LLYSILSFYEGKYSGGEKHREGEGVLAKDAERGRGRIFSVILKRVAFLRSDARISSFKVFIKKEKR